MKNSKYSGKARNQDEPRDDNRDPITGAPGSHPIGTGIGAASAGVAGAAVGTALGGPVGAGVGIVAGAVVGGLAGKAAAEEIDPTAEDAYWRENFRRRSYVETGANYDAYRPGYRAGYEGYRRYRGRRYEEVEPELQRDYELVTGQTGLGWEKARHAARDAWERLESGADQSKPAAPPKSTSNKTGAA